MTATAGPLAGVRVLELAGLGPGPFAAMMLADLGADVVRIDRPGRPEVAAGGPREDILNRGKRSILLDLKHAADVQTALELVRSADILIEGFRPGVTERLGLGPDDCWAHNPALVYGRMTGWGQEGPLAEDAGHDLDYIAVTGALHAMGAADSAPQIPLNLVGDFGGGALYLVAGVLAGLVEATRSGIGQVVDAAICDGTAHLLSSIYGAVAAGAWTDRRESNLLDGGAPFYRVYETADARFVAVAALENRFYTALLDGLSLDEDPAVQHDRSEWPRLHALFQGAFASRSSDEWLEVFSGTDACVAPVVSLVEAPEHPHMKHRQVFAEIDGILQPAPAPRFSRTVTRVSSPPPVPGQHTMAVLREWGAGAGAAPDPTGAGELDGSRLLAGGSRVPAGRPGRAS